MVGAGPLTDDRELAAALEAKQPMNPTHLSLSLPYEPQIQKWTDEGIRWSTIHRTLVDRFGFAGSYSSVRRLAQKLQKQSPKASCILDFVPGDAAQVDFGKGPIITDVFTGEVN